MTTCENDPTIERMRQDLLSGGWTPSFNGTFWTNLMDECYLGPHKAWHIWHGGLMEWIQVVKDRK